MNYNFITTSFQTVVPLHYDIVYYMESPDNEELNNVMRQLQEDGPLFMNTEMLPFPIKLQYVSQRELDGDYLRSQLDDAYDAEDVNKVIENMRECLSADKGGGLTARCIPSFTRDDVMEDDHAVCSCPDFGLLSAEEAFEKAKSFARYVAEENFKRLTNVSYDTYQRAKEDAWRPRRSSGGSGMMNMVVIHHDPNEIDEKKQRRWMKLLSKLYIYVKKITRNGDDAKALLQAALNVLENEGKYKEVYRICIDKNDIYLEISKHERIPVNFGRGAVAKTLYIFFLRLIEYAETNNLDPIYVSQAELEFYYEKELTEIYIGMNGRGGFASIIDGFYNAIAFIRKFFEEVFDENTCKCYSIEKMGVDNDKNNAYGIKLTKKYFELGEYSISRMSFKGKRQNLSDRV